MRRAADVAANDDYGLTDILNYRGGFKQMRNESRETSGRVAVE